MAETSIKHMDDFDLQNKNLFIFDWDGTLADSIELISSCIMDSFIELKFPELSSERAKSIIGLALTDAVKVLLPEHSDHDRDLLLKTYKKIFLQRSNEGIQLFQGVDALLMFLQSRGSKVAVATGKSRAGLERDLSHANVRHLLNTTRTIDECNPKPDPQMIEHIMLELNASREETVMIGDTSFDLEMARNAGVESIAITNGAHSFERLQTCKPLKYFPDFPSFSQYLMNAP